jgi:hypothetical protein
MLRSEKMLPLVAAVEQETGTRPHLSTVIRWATRGCRGVVLETAFVGGRRFTSVESVRRFVNAGTERSRATMSSHTTPHQATVAAAKAAKRLADRLGI